MNRYVVVSTNNNPDYYFYAPYIEKAWNSLGWGLVVMITSDVNPEDLKLSNPESKVFVLPDIEGVRKESIAQAGRLYGANCIEDDCLVMTSDMDLLPLSDYWNPDPEAITNYGHDLTGYSFLPMGYTAMHSGYWKQLFYDMEADAEKYSYMVKSPEWEQWWNWDWRMLTDRLSPLNVIKILRGNRAGSCFAYGRVDRGDSMQIPPGETLIDAHCENVNVQHPDKLNKFLNLFESHYGKL